MNKVPMVVTRNNQSINTSVLGKRNTGGTIPLVVNKKKKQDFPNCKHEQAAILLTCKQGKNIGKEFYKCGLRQDPCDFFQWKED
jgi:hypothetical protein